MFRNRQWGPFKLISDDYNDNRANLQIPQNQNILQVFHKNLSN